MNASIFIRPIHPKTEILPTPAAIRKILNAGWVAQLKIHGHRAQIHISADPKQEILIYNRQGQFHKKKIPASVASELRRLFTPKKNWNVIDAEWLKSSLQSGVSLKKKDSNTDIIYVFDYLKFEGELLNRLSFLERWKYLPRAYISPFIQTLGVLNTTEACLSVFQERDYSGSIPYEFIEGLVFKSSSIGFEDSSIIRCRHSQK